MEETNKYICVVNIGKKKKANFHIIFHSVPSCSNEKRKKSERTYVTVYFVNTETCLGDSDNPLVYYSHEYG